TALALLDYTAVQGTLILPPGILSQSFNIPIIDDTEVEPNETVFVTLFNPTGPAALGLTNTMLTIVDNDFSPGILGFSTNTFAISEGAGNATVTVIRSNGFTGVVSVHYATANGSAQAG